MFTLVHAGNTYATRGGLAIYVKMKKRKGGYSELQTPNGTYVKLKDREIFITRRGFREYKMPLFLEGYDFAVNLDIANNKSAVPSPGIMFINERTNLRFDKRMFLPRKMFLDSGGFLMLAGTADFLDPVELAETYNMYANFGMTLDIPLGNARLQSMERAIFHAHVQKLNTEIIKKHLDGSVTLYNISHGATPEVRTKYMEIVNDPDLDHWACAGSAGSPFDRLQNILITVDNAGRKKLKSIHVLGVASPMYIPILAWLGNYMDITSDASSAMKFASNYCVNELHGTKLAQSYIGNKAGTTGRPRTKDFHPKFMCSCNVCHALGSTELYQKIGTYGASSPHTEVLWVHNQSVYDEYAASWNALARACSPKEYKEHYAKILAPNDRSIVKAIDIIEAWKDSKAVDVCSRFKTYMKNSLGKQVMRTGDPKKFSLANPQEDTTMSKLKTLDACARRYLKYHGDKLKKYAGYLMK